MSPLNQTFRPEGKGEVNTRERRPFVGKIPRTSCLLYRKKRNEGKGFIAGGRKLQN